MDAAVGRHDDDHGRAAGSAVLLEELETAQTRHAHVAQDDVRKDIQRTGETFFAVARGADVVALVGEDQRNRLSQSGLVIDDQYGHINLTRRT